MHELTVGSLDPAGAPRNTSRSYRSDLVQVGMLAAAALLEQTDGMDSRELAAYAAANLTEADLDTLEVEALGVGVLARAFGAFAATHAPSSTRRAHSAWRKLFAHLVATEQLAADPMSGVPRATLRAAADPTSGRADGILALPGDPGEVRDALLATAAGGPQAAAAAGQVVDRWPWPQRDVALIATFLFTAVRLSEVCALNNGSLQGPAGERTLTVVGKGGKARQLAVHPRLEAAIDELRASPRFAQVASLAGPAPLLVDVWGERLRPKQVQYLIQKLYRRTPVGSGTLEQARSAGALVHALRHTVATQLVENGVPTPAVQSWLGHASQDTTMRYVRRVARDQQRVLDAL
jgi:integrase